MECHFTFHGRTDETSIPVMKRTNSSNWLGLCRLRTIAECNSWSVTVRRQLGQHRIVRACLWLNKHSASHTTCYWEPRCESSFLWTQRTTRNHESTDLSLSHVILAEKGTVLIRSTRRTTNTVTPSQASTLSRSSNRFSSFLGQTPLLMFIFWGKETRVYGIER